MSFTLGRLFIIVQTLTLFLIFLDFRLSEQTFKLDNSWFISFALLYPIIFCVGESFFLKPKSTFNIKKFVGLSFKTNIKFNFKALINLNFNLKKIPKTTLISIFLLSINFILFILFLDIDINLEDIRPTLQSESGIANTIIFLARVSQILAYVNILFFFKTKEQFKNVALIYIINAILNAIFIGFTTMSRGSMVILFIISAVSLLSKRYIYKRKCDLILIISFFIISFSYIFIDILRSEAIPFENIQLIIPQLSERVFNLLNL